MYFIPYIPWTTMFFFHCSLVSSPCVLCKACDLKQPVGVLHCDYCQVCIWETLPDMWERVWLPSLKLTARTWNTGVGGWVSFWEGLLSGAMLVFGSVWRLSGMFNQSWGAHHSLSKGLVYAHFISIIFPWALNTVENFSDGVGTLLKLR